MAGTVVFVVLRGECECDKRLSHAGTVANPATKSGGGGGGDAGLPSVEGVAE